MPGQSVVLQLLHACCDRREAVSFHHRKVQERLVALNVSEPKLVGPAGIEVAFNMIIMDRL